MSDSTAINPLSEDIKPDSTTLGKLAAYRQELIASQKWPASDINGLTKGINDLIKLRNKIDINKSGVVDSNETQYYSASIIMLASDGSGSSRLIDRQDAKKIANSLTGQLQSSADKNSTEPTITEPFFGLKLSPKQVGQMTGMLGVLDGSINLSTVPLTPPPPQQETTEAPGLDPSKRAELFSQAFSNATGMPSQAIKTGDKLLIILSPNNDAASSPITNKQATDIIKTALQPWSRSWQRAIGVGNDAMAFSVGSDAKVDSNSEAVVRQNQIIVTLPDSNDPKAEQKLVRFLGQPQMIQQFKFDIARARRITEPDTVLPVPNFTSPSKDNKILRDLGQLVSQPAQATPPKDSDSLSR